MEKRKTVGSLLSVIRHIPQSLSLDTMGFLEASAHGRSGLFEPWLHILLEDLWQAT